MVTQQENKEMAKTLGLGFDCYQPGKEPLCAIGERDYKTGGFVNYSPHLNAKELSGWINGYSIRKELYPIDLRIDEIKEILENNGISPRLPREFITFLNADARDWASKEVKSFIKWDRV